MVVLMPRSSMHRTQAASRAIDYTDRAYWAGIIKMCLSKFFILSVLRRRPMYGYEIAREVETSTEGCCSPTEGTIYPVLREFEEGGYVTVRTQTVSGRERKIYALTRKGRKAFTVAAAAWVEVYSFVRSSSEASD
jgi:PadR family transcriptional regulator PadR